jgi:aspartate aminotransferase
MSIAQLDKKMDRVMVLDGMSKVYAMCGWRLGWGLLPKEIAAGVVRMQTNITSCATSFVQKALPEALLGPQDAPAKMIAEFKRRREFIVEGMNAIEGFTPPGAFYVWPNITGTGWDSRELADYLLTELGVAGLSGTAFGDYGQGYLRFSYANSIENIGMAIDRMKKAMPALIKEAVK